jgi:Holliday junction resolvase
MEDGMGKASREKGKRGEREVASIISEILGVAATRKVRQHNGDSDIVGVPGWCIEVKRYANASEATMRSWWEQAAAQAASSGGIPCVWYRLDRRPWRVLWPLEAALGAKHQWGWEYVVDSTPEAWAAVVRETMEEK